MATGLHWEWRGFGRLDEETRRKIEALPSAYPKSPDGVEFRDRYLWVPDCLINIKLRRGIQSGLKFKRLVDKKGTLELWLEDPNELYPLPIEPAVVEKLAAELGIALKESPTNAVREESELLSLLRQSVPPVREVLVVKRRKTFVRELAVLNRTVRVLVEIADILEPEETVSVSVEETQGLQTGASPDRITAARYLVSTIRDELGLLGSLKTKNYLQALAEWAS